MRATLPLNDCIEANTYITVYNPLKAYYLLNPFIFNKIAAIINGKHNPFDVNSPFFNDICIEFTNENGNDVLLNERRNDYFFKYNLCGDGCQSIGYNVTIGMFICSCSIKTEFNYQIYFGYFELGYIPIDIPGGFYKREKGYSNIKVFKCVSQVFSIKGQKLNFGSYALIICFVAFICLVFFYFVKGRKTIDDEFEKLGNNSNSKPKENSILDNPPGSNDKEKLDYDISTKNQKVTNIRKDTQYSEEDLNSVDYNTALNKDKRSFIRYYWSLIKMKQLCIFTFYTYADHNSKYVKISLFILFLAFNFVFTALFFNDNLIRIIYYYRGNTEVADHLTNIVLSSLCSIIMSYIVRFVCLSERNLMAITREKNGEERKIKVELTKLLKKKLITVFVISGLLIELCWYYVSAYCAVFKNSQRYYFISVLFVFIVSNIWPCATSLIAPFFRIISLKNGNSPFVYKFSQKISYL